MRIAFGVLSNVTQFYSYLWLRDDTTPYYVGKGSGKRAFVKNHGRTYPPKDASRILIFPHMTEAEAFESEMSFIKWFGRKDLGTGCLHNHTDGGEGIAGHQHTAEAKRKMSVAAIGNKRAVGAKRSPEYLKKIGDRTRGRKASPELRGKLSAAHKGKPNNCLGRTLSAQTREKIRVSLTGRKLPAETLTKMSVSLRGRIMTPETKTKMSTARLAWWAKKEKK
jgi:NUMOD3 motif-containing protein